MGYVDLRRREERRRSPREPASLWHTVKNSSYTWLAAAPVAYLLTGWLLVSLWDPITLPGTFSHYAVALAVMIAFVLLGAWQFARRGQRGARPKPGGEKQLLITLRDSDDSITPVEAALETSLTLDEAEETLTRLAHRRHLFVESRDGALYYGLPGKRLRLKGGASSAH